MANRPTVDELAELPEHNPNPVLRLELDGTISLVNAEARRLFDAAELLGRLWRDVCPSTADDDWTRVLAGHRVTLETQVRAARVRFTLVRSNTADVIFVYGSDVTDFRRAERQLSEQAAQLAEMARFPDMNPGPVLRVRRDGTIELANTAAREVFGAELAGQCWWTVCPCVTPDAWAQVLGSDRPVPLEGRIGDCDYVFVHRHDARAAIVFVFGSDVTALRRTERALRQSEKLATLGTLAAGVAHELNNPAAAARRSAGQLQAAFLRFQSAQQALARQPLHPAATVALDALAGEAQRRAPQPSTVSPLDRLDRQTDLEAWLEARALDLPDDTAPSLVALGLTAEGLVELEARVGAAALAASLTWAASLFEVCALLHGIEEAAGRVSTIVSALKEYSYMDRAPIQTVDVQAGIDNTLVILQSKLKTVDVRREYGADVPPIVANGGELNQVWTNLIDNAVAAVNGRGTVTIRTRREDGGIAVEVEDDGPGIRAEHLARVFDPFFTTKPPGKGTGLGLSTVHTIVVEKHGGRVAVASEPGSTRFTVSLPVDGPTHAATGP
jgi:signal transduction histidine kinase